MRPPVPEDAPGLARLMLRAYRGTVDDAGEGEEDALAEVARLLDGAYGRFLAESSRVVVRDGAPISAALVTLQGDRPLLAFSMTDPDHKRTGLARACLEAALDALHSAGWREVMLVVTSTNTPAIALYESMGFTVEVRR